MLERCREALRLFRSCWRSLLLFEILYWLLSRYIVFPLCKGLFYFGLRVTGFHYISTDNMARVFSNPLMIAIMVFLLLLYAMDVIFEITCVITCLHSARLDRHFGIFQVCLEGLKDCVRALRPRSWPLIAGSLLLMPAIQLPTSTSILRLISLPWNILKAYMMKPPLLYAAIGYAALLLILLWLFLDIYQCYTLEDARFAPSARRSLVLGRGMRARNAAFMLLWTAAVCVAVFGGVFLSGRLLNLLLDLTGTGALARYRIQMPFNVLMNYLRSSLPLVLVLAFITRSYYADLERAGEGLPEQAIGMDPKAHRHNAITFYAVAAVCVCGVLLYDSTLRPVLARIDALDYFPGESVAVISHRGYTETSDENTLGAFRSALELGVDYVELDVQLTSDGAVIVNHDSSYKRVFGVNRKVWTVPLEQTRQLYSRRSSEHPPTLEQVLTELDLTANLLVELKNNKHDPALPQEVFALLAEYGCLDRCIIQSTSYRMLREFKALSPDTRCGYILSFALGDYESLEAADFFSIDSDYVDQTAVDAIHGLGKKIFVWTLNTGETISSMAALGIDGIITDDVPLAKATLLIRQDETLLDEIITEAEAELLPAPEEEAEPGKAA
ncbi:MAG: glycerophosphoryl diester phosphodiesterase membrane domain-containing protein [Clostridia bacterium]|nr:glycerophosphoryl diester phosphodiesterase membrane domain-containing protein [Clostridia bacterium]